MPARISPSKNKSTATRTPAPAKKTARPPIANPYWPRTCIVVADGGSARILLASRKAAAAAAGGRGTIVLEQVASLDNPAAHLPARALVTDRTGRVFDSGSRSGRGPKSRARHGAQSDYDPHDVEVQRFAKRLVRLLNAERVHLHIEEMIVIAAPRFLGVLRPQLPAPIRKLVKREIDRDLVHADDRLISRTAFPRMR
ncbi:MAG TPA: host attachment protein [Steroidobacteraceae bacterium]|nr:host attachment protein [Steroidobacteraceae bacterium]